LAAAAVKHPSSPGATLVLVYTPLTTNAVR
jgi:hypothetical protein